MNGFENLPEEIGSPGQHTACLSLGSNIQPAVYLPRALAQLSRAARVVKTSACWETSPFDGSGPNFINLAVCLSTHLDISALKSGLIASIENELGRVRTADKNAPRTIDLDIIVFDGRVINPALWERAYLALTISEFLPDLQETSSGRSLHSIASELSALQPAILRPGFLSPTS